MWLVKIVSLPVITSFPREVVPRKYHYKKDAERIAAEVRSEGGVAVIVKIAK
jgi:hypothetical protein